MQIILLVQLTYRQCVCCPVINFFICINIIMISISLYTITISTSKSLNLYLPTIKKGPNNLFIYFISLLDLALAYFPPFILPLRCKICWQLIEWMTDSWSYQWQNVKKLLFSPLEYIRKITTLYRYTRSISHESPKNYISGGRSQSKKTCKLGITFHFTFLRPNEVDSPLLELYVASTDDRLKHHWIMPIVKCFQILRYWCMLNRILCILVLVSKLFMM